MNLFVISTIFTLAFTPISCDDFDNNTPPWNRETFAAVTQFEDLERYYLELRSKERKRFTKQPSMDVVRRICESIFSSPYFEMNQQDHWLPADCKVLHASLQTYPSVFKHICQECNQITQTWYKLIGRDGCSSGYRYENPYKSRPLLIHHDDRRPFHLDFERVFVCLTKKRETDADNIKEYFVSVEYDVNDVAEGNVPVYSRFIFTRNMEKRLVIHAMAEEAAQPLDEGLRYSKQTYKHEWFYYVSKHRFRHYELPHEDPICRLNPVQKLRLYATIFSSPPFRASRFFPTTDRVRTGCEPITVSFHNQQREEEARKERNKLLYQDWMIACVVSPAPSADPDADRPETYYVSRGLRSNHVFVHESVDGRVYVKFYMVNVGAVLESDVLEE